MADYWKSQNRIFCDFCKCWITDNKPSVDFHNNGKRHQANVQKRIGEIHKKNDADKKAQNKLDDEMRKINEAAMRSYAKDISSGTDFTSRAIGHASSSSSSTTSKAVDPMALPYYYDEENGPNVSKKSNTATSTAVGTSSSSTTAPTTAESMWCEAVTDEGYTYYWNIKTNESVWEKPKEGFMTIDEYNKLNEVVMKKQEEAHQKDLKYHVENADELAAAFKREQLKKYQKITQRTDKKETDSTEGETSSSSKLKYEYGYQPSMKWETVREEKSEEEEKYVDLELPKQNDVYYAVANIQNDEPPIKKFKEKTITTTLDSDEIPSTFKKRKIANRSIRKANDDA